MVIHLHLAPEDLGRIRFAFSPLRETGPSLRTLTAPTGGLQLHEAWRQRVRDRLSDVDMELLTAVVRPAGDIPAFLVPPPPRRRPAPER